MVYYNFLFTFTKYQRKVTINKENLKYFVHFKEIFHDNPFLFQEDEDYPEDLLNSEEYKELQELRKLRINKLQHEKTALIKHIGYKVCLTA